MSFVYVVAESMLLVLYVVVCCVTPVTLIWGWVRWAKRPRQKTLPEVFSLTGLALATASGLLAISTLIYGQAIGGFPFYDPRLLRIYRWGSLLSLAGVAFGIAGLWRPSPLRWFGPVCSFGTLLFWVMATSGE